MTNSSAVDPRYPIGDFVSPTTTALADIDGWIRDIAACPTRLRESVAALTEEFGGKGVKLANRARRPEKISELNFMAACSSVIAAIRSRSMRPSSEE